MSMVYVCVSGYGGTGKSVFCETITKYDNRFIHIEVDKIIDNIIQNEESELVYEVNKRINDKVTIKEILNACFFDDEKSKILHQCFIDYLNAKVIEEIKKYNKLSKIPLIDWFACEKLSIFPGAIYKVHLIASQDTRISRVIEREGKSLKQALSVENTVKYNHNYDVILDTDEFDYKVNNITNLIERKIKV